MGIHHTDPTAHKYSPLPRYTLSIAAEGTMRPVNAETGESVAYRSVQRLPWGIFVRLRDAVSVFLMDDEIIYEMDQSAPQSHAHG